MGQRRAGVYLLCIVKMSGNILFHLVFFFIHFLTSVLQMNGVLATNSDFLIPFFATQCCRPLVFQTMNSVRSNNLSLKYQRFSPSYNKNKGIRLFQNLAKTQVSFN